VADQWDPLTPDGTPDIPSSHLELNALVNQVRSFMRDYPELNRLIAGYESSNRQIMWAILDCLDDYNTSPPFSAFGISNFPSKSLLVRGVVCSLLESIGLLQTRNHLQFTDGGIQVGVNDKTPFILAAALPELLRVQEGTAEGRHQHRERLGWGHPLRVPLREQLLRGVVMDSNVLEGFVDEMEKIASKAAIIGGLLGGGAMALHGGLKEWDQRHSENQAVNRMPGEQQAIAKEWLKSDRNHRLARLAVRTGIGGAAGAGAGHALGKAVELTAKTMADKVKPALQEALAEGFKAGVDYAKPAIQVALDDGLHKGLQGGLQDGARGLLWRAINPFKKG
jgi:hypothetical protein